MGDEMTKQQAKTNLRAAHLVIHETHTKLAALPSDTADDERAELQDQVRHAKETTTTCTLAILMRAAEAEAAELIALEKRRSELLTSLRVYSQGLFQIDARPPYESRAVSAALLLASESPEPSEDALRAAVHRWANRFEEIHQEVSDGDSDR